MSDTARKFAETGSVANPADVFNRHFATYAPTLKGTGDILRAFGNTAPAEKEDFGTDAKKAASLAK